MLNTYYRNCLNTDQVQIYDDICNGIDRHMKTINVQYTENMVKVLSAVNYDNPQFFFVNWLDSISYTVISERAVLRMNYIYSEGEVIDLTRKIFDISKRIAGISDQGKALGIHDWFINNIKYDHNGLKRAIRSPGMFSAAGPLTSQKAVCEGISKLACYLLRIKGVDAAIATGASQDGTPHAWNIINIYGKTLYADITYDMGISDSEHICRKYFLLSREEMDRDHILNRF